MTVHLAVFAFLAICASLSPSRRTRTPGRISRPTCLDERRRIGDLRFSGIPTIGFLERRGGMYHTRTPLTAQTYLTTPEPLWNSRPAPSWRRPPPSLTHG